MKNKLFKINGMIILICLLCAYPVSADTAEKDAHLRWEFDMGGSLYTFSGVDNFTIGPEATIHYKKKQRSILGFYTTLYFPAASQHPDYYSVDKALSFDLGYSVAPWRKKSWFRFGVGFSTVFGGDANGDGVSSYGFHVKLRVFFPIKKTFYLWTKVIFRSWLLGSSSEYDSSHRFDSKSSFGCSAGIGFRF